MLLPLIMKCQRIFRPLSSKEIQNCRESGRLKMRVRGVLNILDWPLAAMAHRRKKAASCHSQPSLVYHPALSSSHDDIRTATWRKADHLVIMLDSGSSNWMKRHLCRRTGMERERLRDVLFSRDVHAIVFVVLNCISRHL